MVVTPAFDQPGRMLDVKHLVIQDVLHEPFGNVLRVKCFADRDAIVDVIVVTQNAASPALRPGYRWFADPSVEILSIQFGEHSIKVVNLTLG